MCMLHCNYRPHHIHSFGWVTHTYLSPGSDFWLHSSCQLLKTPQSILHLSLYHSYGRETALSLVGNKSAEKLKRQTIIPKWYWHYWKWPFTWYTLEIWIQFVSQSINCGVTWKNNSHCLTALTCTFSSAVAHITQAGAFFFFEMPMYTLDAAPYWKNTTPITKSA